MATWGTTKTLVKYNLGRTGDTNLDTLLPIWADIFQKKAQRDRNYWFLKTVAERSIVNTSQIYPLPDNFKDDMIFYLKKLTTAGFSANEFVELDPITDIDVVRLYAPVVASTQKGQPEAYTIGDQSITLWPYPDQSYTLRCQYWKDVDPPVSGSLDSFTNAWIADYPDLYAEELTAAGFSYLGEGENAMIWEARAKRTLADVRAANVARELPGKLVLVPMRDQFGTTRASLSNTWRIYN